MEVTDVCAQLFPEWRDGAIDAPLPTPVEFYNKLMTLVSTLGVNELWALAAPLYDKRDDPEAHGRLVRQTTGILRQELWTQTFVSLRYAGIAAADTTLFETKVEALESQARVNAMIGRYRVVVAHILALAILRAAGNRASVAATRSGPELGRHIILVLVPACRLVASAFKLSNEDRLLDDSVQQSVDKIKRELIGLLRHRRQELENWARTSTADSAEYTLRMRIELPPSGAFASEREVIRSLVNDAVDTALVELGDTVANRQSPPTTAGGLDTDRLAAMAQQLAQWTREHLHEKTAMDTTVWAPLAKKDLRAAFDNSAPAVADDDGEQTVEEH